MKIGYWRNWPSGPKRQEADLREAGCEKLYGEPNPHPRDPLRERFEAIRTLRPGDELVVVAPEVLGRSQAEILEALAEAHRVSKGGAAIRDLSSGEVVRWHPDVQGPLDFVARGAANLLQRRTSAAGKASARGGRKPALQGKTKALAKADWLDPSIPPMVVAAKYGVTIKTLYKWLGPRSGK